jgi:hypothetical protein
VRPIERTDRHLVCHHLAETFPGEPGMKVKGGRFDLERRLAQLRKVEVDRMIGSRTDRARTARERGQRCAVNMAAGDKLNAWMTGGDLSQLVGIGEVLAIHVPDAGSERRMVQE